MEMKMAYTSAKMLIGRPNLPRRNGPYGMSSWRSLAMMKKRIGMMYEMYRARVLSDRMAKKAVVEPRLIRLRSMTMKVTSINELSGMRRRGWTWKNVNIRYVISFELLTLLKKLENGRPLS